MTTKYRSSHVDASSLSRIDVNTTHFDGMCLLGLGVKVISIFIYFYLSYDVTVIQWITSCHKPHKHRMTTRVIIHNVIDKVCVSNAFSH